jgi:uncharacterized phage-associated protein
MTMQPSPHTETNATPDNTKLPSGSAASPGAPSVRAVHSFAGNLAMPAVTTAPNFFPNEVSIAAVKHRVGKAAAIEVARFLVYLAYREEEPDFLSHLRLQKLLYYVQGWSLALRSKPMFVERVEAWAHGPVVPVVYHAFSGFGFQPILLRDIGLPANLVDEEMQFIGSVWQQYKQFSASSLREMTHKESPWMNARVGLGPADRCEKEITQKAMRDFFSMLAK